MEITRTSKSGRVYRIIKLVPAWELYTIEYLSVGHLNDGSEYKCWYPAYEPKNKVFDSLSDCKIAFMAFLQS